MEREGAERGTAARRERGERARGGAARRGAAAGRQERARLSPRNGDGEGGGRKRGSGAEAPGMGPQRRKVSRGRGEEEGREKLGAAPPGEPRAVCRHFSERTELPTRKVRAGERGGERAGEKKKSLHEPGKSKRCRRLPVAPRTGSLCQSLPPRSRTANSRGSRCPAALPWGTHQPPPTPRQGTSKKWGRSLLASRLGRLPRRAAGQAPGCCSKAGEEEQPAWETRVAGRAEL